MKLLYLANGYPPRHTAGTENYTAGIARAMARAGHAVEVICVGEWDTGPQAYNGIETAVHDGVTVHRLNINWMRGPDPNRALFDSPERETAVTRLVEALRPEVVHLTSATTLSASALRPVQRGGYALVVTLTDFWFLCPQFTLRRSDGTLCDGQTTPWECLQCLLRPSGAYRWLRAVLPERALEPGFAWASRQPWLARQRGLRGMALDMAARKRTLLPLLEAADAIIAPSRFLAEMFAANGLKKTVQVIPYGHDLEWARRVRPKPPGGPVVVGYAGRLTEAKGVHVLVEAAARLEQDLPLEVHIYGDPNQEPAYGERLRDLARNAPRVKFRGKFGRDELDEVLSALDVVAVPSLWYENNPLIAQEAFAAGRPVIASDLGGMAEFVEHEVSGWLFPPGDVEALAGRLGALALRPEQIEPMRGRLPRVRTTDEERETLEALYEGLLRVRTPARAGVP